MYTNDVSASTEARYSRAISSYFSNTGQQQTSDANGAHSRATQRQNRAASGKYSSGNMDDDYAQDSYSSNAQQSSQYDAYKQRHPGSASRVPTSNATITTREKRASSRSAGPSYAPGAMRAAPSHDEQSNATSNRTNRLLSSHQYTGPGSTSSSATTYNQPATPLELLRQPLVVLDSNIRIEKFNEDTGDLEAKSRTPSVRVMTKRDPARLQATSGGSSTSARSSGGSASSSSGGANTPLTTDRPASTGSNDDFANTGAYQPRVPSRKAGTAARSTSRVANAKKTATVSRHHNSGDTHSARSNHSHDDYADNYSAGSRGSVDDYSNNNYTEYTSKPAAAQERKSSVPQKRAPSVSTKRAPAPKEQRGYSASRHDQQDEEDTYSAPPPRTQKKPTSSYPPVDNMPGAFAGDLPEDAYADEPLDLIPCSVCGRKFAADRLEKHQKACKTASKPRKKFDIAKQRLDAEARQAARQAKPEEKKRTEMPANKMPKWKRDHLHFQQVLRAGRPQANNGGGGGSSGGGYGRAAHYEEEIIDDRVACPHCGRKYNADVADRHIPRCKNIINKPKTIRKGQGNAAGVSALTSRTTTGAPPQRANPSATMAAPMSGGNFSTTTRRMPSTTSTRRTTSRIRR